MMDNPSYSGLYKRVVDGVRPQMTIRSDVT